MLHQLQAPTLLDNALVVTNHTIGIEVVLLYGKLDILN